MKTNRVRLMAAYLLGELSEPERVDLERAFFSDPQLFDLLVRTETQLVDHYVRNRLSARHREQFERHYLAHPRRRARAELGHGLLERADASESADGARPTSTIERMWHAAIEMTRAPRMSVSVAAGVIAVLLTISAVLLFDTIQLRRQLAEAQMAKAQSERQERALQDELSRARGDAANLTGELERLTRQSHQANDPVALPPTIVSLFLSVQGVRAPNAAPSTLAVPSGTQQVRFELAMDEGDYPTYQLALKPVGGAEVFVRRRIPPQRSPSAFRITVTMPADRLAAGDYQLTLSGERPNGEVDIVSESLVRVQK